MATERTLEQQIVASDNVEELRQVLKNDLAAKGVIRRTSEGAYVPTATATPPAPAAEPLSVNPEQDTQMRVIYPAGNNRFEIYGASEAELDAKEARIRAMFGGNA